MPSVIDEQLFERDTPVPEGDHGVTSRSIDVRGAQQVNVTVLLGGSTDADVSCNIGFGRTADSMVIHRHDRLDGEGNIVLAASMPVFGPLLQVIVTRNVPSGEATCFGWVYGVREAS